MSDHRSLAVVALATVEIHCLEDLDNVVLAMKPLARRVDFLDMSGFQSTED